MHNIPDFLRIPSEMQEHFAKGGMIKRADGSYSRRGLWDNIRANKGSGRKPTKEMLKQEAKIRSEEQYGGRVEEFGKGGYTVRRSNARKGKTHVVIGPDGTKKYFGDSKLGQHPSDPARKKAFYARHKHNLANNPYFRAFARATWEDGGYIPEYQDGTAAVDLTEVTISPREYKELSNEELRALHNKVGRPESSDRSNTLPRIIKDSLHNAGAIKRLRNAITNSTGATNIIVGPSTQYEGNNGQYYALTPREAEQYNQYESNLPWYKNLWYNVATRDIPEGSRLANYEQRQGAYMNNFPYVYTDTNGEATQLNTPVVYRGKTYTTPFIVNPEEEGSVYYSDGTVAPSYRPNTNNSTQVNPQWIAQMQQQGFRNGGYYAMPQARIEPSDIHLNLPNTTRNQMSPLGLNSFLVNDKNQGIVIGGVNPRFQTEDFSVGPYARMVGNRQFQAPMYGVAGTYHVNDNVDLSGEVGSNGFSAGLNYRFRNGGSYGPFYNRRDAAKLQRWRTPMASSMTPSFSVGGLNVYQSGTMNAEPVTGNSGQGINTTTTVASPATAQPFGMMAPQPVPQAPSPLTNESLTSYLQSNAPENIASRQNTEDYNYQQSMQKDFGKSMDEVDMAYKDVATAHPNYTNQEILKTVRTNYQDELNKKNADLKNQSMKAEQARLKSIAGTMKGASQAFDAGLAGLDLLSRMNPNSSQMAVLKQNRENANPMNTMNIVGNRKGIEYAAHGGYTGLKEGVELNLTTQQIHELEKQGYKFQII
jgi:hypothetical protein